MLGMKRRVTFQADLAPIFFDLALLVLPMPGQHAFAPLFSEAFIVGLLYHLTEHHIALRVLYYRRNHHLQLINPPVNKLHENTETEGLTHLGQSAGDFVGESAADSVGARKGAKTIDFVMFGTRRRRGSSGGRRDV